MIFQRQYRSIIQDLMASLLSFLKFLRKDLGPPNSQGDKVKVGDDVKLMSDFLKEVDENILFEIFVRLPNCRSAILFGSVCRNWHSLISRPQFIPRFISHHREHGDRYSLPYTIIFRKADKLMFGPDKLHHYFRPICKLFSEESLFLHGKSASTSNYLDFLPCPMVIRASCNDLLLVYSCERDGLGWGSDWPDDLYICNPITKQFYELPQFPRPNNGRCKVLGHALVCIPTNHFKVVEFCAVNSVELINNEKTISLVVSIFCSKSGKWGREFFRYPNRFVSPKELEVVTCNGIAYWMENEGDGGSVFAFDLLNSEYGGAIDSPDDFSWFSGPQNSVREQIGAVCGELRLLQVVLICEEAIVNLKVWQLNCSKDWVLIHDKKNLTRPSNQEEFIGAFVHPTNGDVVLMVWDRNVFEYSMIMEYTYQITDECHELLGNKHSIYKRLVSFPMVHPAWPTLLPYPSV